MAKKIVLDPGHGGTDPGASGKMSYYGATAVEISEKNLALDFAQAVKAQLITHIGATVYMTRTTDVKKEPAERTKIAHDNAADAFLSIHFNAANKTAKGTETFYADTRSGDKTFATAIQNNLVNWFGVSSDRGVKSDTSSAVGSLFVLRDYKDDAYVRALVEVEFIDNLTVMNDTIGYDYNERVLDFASAIVKGFQAYWNI